MALKRPYNERWRVERTFLTYKQAARLLGVTVAWLHHMERIGLLLTSKYGVPRSEMEHLRGWT